MKIIHRDSNDKRFDHIIGKRYISTCYVCMYICNDNNNNNDNINDNNNNNSNNNNNNNNNKMNDDGKL